MSGTTQERWKQTLPSLFQQAVWCGIAFSVAGLIGLLNFLPPIDVHFRVRAQIIASPQRIAALREKLRTDLHAMHEGIYTEAQLLSVTILEDGNLPELESQPRRQILKLVEVDSRWQVRAKTGQVREWLESITRVQTNVLNDYQAMRDERFAQWNARSTQHYLDHYRYTQTRDSIESLEPTVQATEPPPAGTAPQSAMRLISTIRSVQEDRAEPTVAPQPLDVERRLQDNVAVAQQDYESAVQSRKRLQEEIAGVMALSGSPRIRALPGSFPVWLAVGSLIFAMALGLTSAWVQFRLQSGGAYEPNYVAELLASDGLPCIDCVSVGADQDVGDDWMESTGRVAVKLTRRFSCVLTNVGEWTVLIWCLVISFRLVFDPLWRTIFMSSPLAGLGRLLIGLP